MKYGGVRTVERRCGRTPHGVRGLKLADNPMELAAYTVAPLTGCVD